MFRLSYLKKIFIIFVSVILIVFFSMILWLRLFIHRPNHTLLHNEPCYESDLKAGSQSCPESIPCLINGKQSNFDCLYDLPINEVYIPFSSFLGSYFEIDGYLVQNGSSRHFDWWHSYSPLKFPTKPYETLGSFLNFMDYNVEMREHVSLISGQHGVPMSSQWQSEPYFYPVQIAQFGLQHYSKNITRPGDQTTATAVSLAMVQGFGDPAVDISSTEHGVYVQSSSTNSGVTISLPRSSLATFSAELGWNSPCEIAVSVEILNNKNDSTSMTDNSGRWISRYKLVYRHSSDAIIASRTSRTIVYGLGLFESVGNVGEIPVHTFTRNFYIDLMKGLDFATSLGGSGMHAQNNRFKARKFRSRRSRSLPPDSPNIGAPANLSNRRQDRRKSLRTNNKIPSRFFRVTSITLTGMFTLSGPRLFSAAGDHHTNTLAAADWLLDNQDANGGWPIPARRKLTSAQSVLEIGWYSAMAQGHAISLLVRTYGATRNPKYLVSAGLALKVYAKPASEGGVMNELWGVHPWYEEYPTLPGSFVLNGFIFSLLGLYDYISFHRKSGYPISVGPPQANLNYAESPDAVDDTVLQSVGEAEGLLRRGLRSLVAMLPMFDSGFGSFYDLRHISIPGLEPNRARWDYHTLHVYLLLVLHDICHQLDLLTGNSSLNSDGLSDLNKVTRTLFKSTAERWSGYAEGKRARHN